MKKDVKFPLGIHIGALTSSSSSSSSSSSILHHSVFVRLETSGFEVVEKEGWTLQSSQISASAVKEARAPIRTARSQGKIEFQKRR